MFMNQMFVGYPRIWASSRGVYGAVYSVYNVFCLNSCSRLRRCVLYSKVDISSLVDVLMWS